MVYLHIDRETVVTVAHVAATAEVKRMNSEQAELYSATNHHFVSFIDLMIDRTDVELLSESATDREIRG